MLMFSGSTTPIVSVCIHTSLSMHVCLNFLKRLCRVYKAMSKPSKQAPPQKGDKRSSACEVMDPDKRMKIISGLANTGGVSKTGLANILKALTDQGMLAPFSNAQASISYQRHVREGVEDIPLHAVTPYGPLIKVRQLPITEDARGSRDGTQPHQNQHVMYVVSPFALMSYLCSKNDALFDLFVATAARTNHRFNIVLYIDEINPGNPLAPDPQKLLQAIYWTFLEFPNWFLRRKDSWFCMSIVKTKLVHKLDGYISELVKHALYELFPPRGDSFQRGCSVSNGHRSLTFTAEFEGVLADEKGLKEVFDIKGQGGANPCLTCLNVRNRFVRIGGKPDLQRHWDPDLSKRRYATDLHVKAITQRLSDAAQAGLSNTQQNALSTQVGVNYNPTGILFDTYLNASVLHPVKNYLRDWMHTLVSNGVTGTHIALVCHALDSIGCNLDIVRLYANKFQLPLCRNRGKVSDLFFKDTLVAGDHVRHFAGDVLGMVPLLHSFLEEKIKPRGALVDNIECFSLMHNIIVIVRRGKMDSTIHAKMLQYIVKHNTMFVALYGDKHAKIKFHHLYHLPDDLLRMGSCVSCFPTERKHKDVLAVANATDRDIEKTASIAFLHRTIYHWHDNADACKPCFLRQGRDTILPGFSSPMKAAMVACLHIGDVHHGDMVILTSGDLGSIIDFWESKDEMNVRLYLHTHLGGSRFSLKACRIVIDKVPIIVDVVAFRKADDHISACIPAW